MQIKNILISTLFLSVVGALQTKSEDLFETYQSQQGCSWENSQYKYVDGVSSTESRKCIDSQGNIFSISRSLPNPRLIGNINKQEVTTGNSCNPLFGTNIQCLSNVVKTTYQYKDINGALTQFSREDFNGSIGNVRKNIIGIKLDAKELLEEESNRLNNIAMDYYKKRDLRSAIVYGTSSLKWYPSVPNRFNRGTFYLDNENYQEALNDFNYVEQNIDKTNEISKGWLYELLAETKYRLNYDSQYICTDFKKAMQIQGSINETFAKPIYLDSGCNR